MHATRECKERHYKDTSKNRESEMVSREPKRGGVHEKLQVLRSITQSHAGSKASIIEEASKYIHVLKDKVDRLRQEMTASSTQTSVSSSLLMPQVTVETMEKGFLVKVYAERSMPGQLVSVLEALEELNLEVIEARVSCIDTFRFQAIGGLNEEEGEIVDAQVVKQTVLQAINQSTQKWC